MQSTTAPAPFPSSGDKLLSRGSGDVLGQVMNVPGFATPEPATIQTWRKMRANPTVAIARIASGAPVRANQWSYEADDGISPDAVAVVQRSIDRLRVSIVKHALTALDYGFAAFETTWQVDSGSLVPWSLRPLLPDTTEAIVDECGQVVGAEHQAIPITAANLLWFSYDGEADAPYGRSRHENIRSVWSAWTDTLARLGKYTTKTSGVIPMIQYPEGKSRDATGSEVDNFELAKKVLSNLSLGAGVAMPNTLVQWAAEAVNRGVDITQLRAWIITFLESRAGHGDEYLAALQHFERLMLRGWLVPERSVTEGQHGTNAEAETHGDFAIAAASHVLEDIIACVQTQLVDRMLRLNYGPGHEGTIRVKAAELDVGLRDWLRGLISSAVTGPLGPDLLGRVVAIDQLLDLTGAPRREDGPVDLAPTTIADNVARTNHDPSTTDNAPTSEVGLTAAQITSVITVLERMQDGLLTPAVASELLLAVGMNADAVGRVVASMQTIETVVPTTPPTMPPRGSEGDAMSRSIAALWKLG